MNGSTTALLLLACMAAAPAGAEVYRWVDGQGRVHFGDRPPADRGEQVDIRPAPEPETVPRPAAVPDRRRLLDMYEQERADRRAAKEQAARERAERRRDCQQVERTLRRYLAGGPLYEDRPDGSRYYFTAAEKDAEMAELRGILAQHCGGVPADLKPRQGR